MKFFLLLPTTTTSLLLLLLASRVALAQNMTDREQQLAGLKEICFEGFVMDFFCINRGTLLDNPRVNTLEEPERHSFHCLLDVNRCVSSGYEMLLDPQFVGNGTGNRYGRALRLNADGNEQVLRVARPVGERGYCSSCTGPSGSIDEGFRATVYGFLVPNSGSPPTLNVTEVRATTGECGDEMFIPNVDQISVVLGGGNSAVKAHGGFMVTAWGFILPFGVISARFLRHRPDGLWFKIHMGCQILGYALACIGLIVAFANFGNVFEDGMGASFRHAVCGLVTMICGLLQVINGLNRPHAPQPKGKDDNDEEEEEEGEGKTKIRFVWEILHKATGYSTIVLAYVTIYFGSEVAGVDKDTFRGVFYGTLVFAALASMAAIMDKLMFNTKQEEEEEQQQQVPPKRTMGNEQEEQATEDKDDVDDKA